MAKAKNGITGNGTTHGAPRPEWQHNNDTDNHPFPSDFIDPAVKATTKHGLKLAKAIFAQWQWNRANSSNDITGNYITNRLYARGKQSINKYKSHMNIQGGSSFLNLDFSEKSPVAKMVELLIGEWINQDYEAVITAIDQNTVTSKDEARRRYYAALFLKKFDEQSREVTGVPVINPNDIKGEDSEEIELYMSMTHKEATEIAMEEAIEYIMANHEWRTIYERMVRDLVENRIGCLRVYRDRNHSIRVRYVDIVNFISSYTDQPDFSNTKYFGEIRQMTIGDIRAADKEGVLSEKDLFEIASNFSGRNNNVKWRFGDYYNFNGYYKDLEYNFDDYNIDTLDFYVRTIDSYTYEQKTTPGGGMFIKQKPQGFRNEAAGEGKKYFDISDEVSYEGMWVVSTDFVFNYGKTEVMPREKKKGSYSPELLPQFIVYSPGFVEMDNKSVVERIRPNVDAMNNYKNKLQLYVQKAAPPGLSIDLNAISNLELESGKEYKPLELIDLYQQTGIMLYGGPDDDDPYHKKPIEVLEGGLSSKISSLVELYRNEYHEMQEKMGLSPAKDTQAPDRHALVGNQKISIASSNNATRSIHEGIPHILRRMYKTMAWMIQDNFSYLGGMDGYKRAIGEHGVKALEFSKEFLAAEWGISIEALPIGDDKEKMELQLQKAVDEKQITLEDKFRIEGVKNTKKQKRYLSQAIKKMRQIRMAEEEQKHLARASADQQTAKVSHELEVKKLEMSIEAEQAKISAELAADLQRVGAEKEKKLAEIDQEGMWKSKHIQEAAGLEFDETTLSSEQKQPSIVPSTPVPSVVP